MSEMCGNCGLDNVDHGIEVCLHQLDNTVRHLRQKLAASERELDDVRELDELACRHGTRLDIPAEISGFDPGDGSDHLHFVLMPIGARSRRAAVEYLAAKLDKAGR